MFSHTLKRIAVVSVMVGGLGLASGNSAEAIELGVIKVKLNPVPARESIFRAAISDSRRRSEHIQRDVHLDKFRASAVSSVVLSARAVDTDWISARLDNRSRTTTSPTLNATRDLVLRYWNAPVAATGRGAVDKHNSASMFRAAAQLTSAH
jgi:hypothetical protein